MTIKIEKMLIEASMHGYKGKNVQAKVCQDLILKAISESELSHKATIKGGVVMRSLSGSIRRATLDIDIDFIRYSIENDSVDSFIRSLNCLNGLRFTRFGSIKELHHQDYRGRRVIIKVEDEYGKSITCKVDLGVHKDLSILQEEFCFEVSCYNGKAILLVNGKEQMVSEKLCSLLRFGSFSRRFKDVFDIYYLLPFCNENQLAHCFESYIFNNPASMINNKYQIGVVLRRIFKNKRYYHELIESNANWTDTPTDSILSQLVEFFIK